MINWQDNVHRPVLISHKSGQAIQAGEKFYSTLHMEILKGEQLFVRWDYREEEWDESIQENCLSWWCQTLPTAKDDKKQQLLNATVLLGIFNDMKQSNSRHEQCFLYCLSLLLMRLKKLRYLDLVHEDDGDYIVLQERGTKTCYRIRDPEMSTEEETIVKRNLEQIFSVNHAEAETDSSESPSAEPTQAEEPDTLPAS